MVVSILSIVTFLLIRERGSVEMAATRAASNIVQLIDADVLRNVELYDVSLRGLISASQREDLKQVSPTIRHMALFDRATAAPYKGNILLLDSRGDVLADSASVEPRKGNFADREYFQSHVDNPDPGMLISRPFRARPSWIGASVSAGGFPTSAGSSSAWPKRPCAWITSASCSKA